MTKYEKLSGGPCATATKEVRNEDDEACRRGWKGEVVFLKSVLAKAKSAGKVMKASPSVVL